MEVEVEEAMEIADERKRIRVNNRKEKSRRLRSYCKDLDFNIISSSTDDLNKSLEVNNSFDDVLICNDTRVNNQNDISVFCPNDTIEQFDEPGSINLLQASSSGYCSHVEEMNNEKESDQIVEFLHQYTDVPTCDFCYNLLKVFRDLRISKNKYRKFINLIKSILPNPNSLPLSMEQLLSILNINDNIFTKRKVCLLCANDISGNLHSCPHCPASTETSIAIVYDADIRYLLFLLLKRVWTEMINYKKLIRENNDIYESNDIPFGAAYQDLLRQYWNETFVTSLLHLDGVSLFQSNKLKMWLFSFSIVELPATIRYRRFNMPVISIWISYVEPNASLWLRSSMATLEALKISGIVVSLFL